MAKVTRCTVFCQIWIQSLIGCVNPETVEPCHDRDIGVGPLDLLRCSEPGILLPDVRVDLVSHPFFKRHQRELCNGAQRNGVKPARSASVANTAVEKDRKGGPAVKRLPAGLAATRTTSLRWRWQWRQRRRRQERVCRWERTRYNTSDATPADG